MDAIVWFILTLCAIFIVILVLLVFVTGAFPSSVKLSNCHVIITGGSSGIGLEIAKECYKNGSHVTIIARNQEKLQAAKISIQNSLENGALVQVVSADISGSAIEVCITYYLNGGGGRIPCQFFTPRQNHIFTVEDITTRGLGKWGFSIE